MKFEFSCYKCGTNQDDEFEFEPLLVVDLLAGAMGRQGYAIAETIREQQWEGRDGDLVCRDCIYNEHMTAAEEEE